MVTGVWLVISPWLLHCVIYLSLYIVGRRILVTRWALYKVGESLQNSITIQPPSLLDVLNIVNYKLKPPKYSKMDRHYSERVPMLPNMNQAEFSRSESERSVSPAISDENLPIRKRYTRSHEYLSDSASQNFASQNFSSQNFSSQTFPSQNFSSPSNGYSSNEESSSVAVYSSADESDKEVALDYSKPRKVVRAGVIRHSSNPSSCLAYYYLHKY